MADPLMEAAVYIESYLTDLQIDGELDSTFNVEAVPETSTIYISGYKKPDNVIPYFVFKCKKNKQRVIFVKDKKNAKSA